MKRVLSNGLLFGVLCFSCLGGVGNAQAPSGGGASQQQPTPQRPSSPDMNAPGQNPDAMTLKKIDDKQFLKNAALGGMTEVELGKLAAQKGTSEDVKQFGQKMVDDHGKANDQLKEIAAKAQVEVPSSLDSKHQKNIDKLSQLSGEKFDKAYVKGMLKDHRKDVSEFQAEAQNGTDPNVKQFAANTLPVLQEHLKMIEDLSKKSK